MSHGEIQQVLIVGAGAIGRQIAVSCAANGFGVTLFDIDPNALIAAEAACRRRLEEAHPPTTGAHASANHEIGTIRTSTDAAQAAADADLLIESVPERLQIKRDVFRQFAQLCPPHTIFVTNTSVLMPSMMVAATGRPDRFAALHFLMECDMTEIMSHDRTSAETVAALEAFSRRIGHVPVRCRREQPGYLVNTMLMALNGAALTLVANGVAAFEDVDRAWMKATQAIRGPFGWLDLVGLDIALEITQYGAKATGSAQTKKNGEYLKQLVDRGHLGVKSGQGFYSYPGPAYQQPQFLSLE
ncbi:MAG: 3-hydroxyacyl-CoA dehydrogenase NAD-binding domain-containing protein [Planctomycetaceae bacterium]